MGDLMQTAMGVIGLILYMLAISMNVIIFIFKTINNENKGQKERLTPQEERKFEING